MAVSALRTVVIGAPSSLYGVYPVLPMLRWPMAEPDDLLDYSLDATAPLVDVAPDTIVAAELSISPSGSGELSPSSLKVNGTVLTAWLGGGVAGRSYLVRVDAETAAGRSFEWIVGLFVDATLASSPIPPPPNAGFGTPIVWDPFATPVPGLFFSNPHNWSAWPFGCTVTGPGVPLDPNPIPSLIFDDPGNWSAWPFGCSLAISSMPTPTPTPTPTPPAGPSLDFALPRNVGLWFAPLGQVIGVTPIPTPVPIASGLVATGTDQVTALLLPALTNIFTSAPSGTGAVLPAIADTFRVVNATGNDMLLYPPGDAQIGSGAAGVAVIVSANATVDFETTSPTTQWYAS